MMSHIFGVRCITNREALVTRDSEKVFLELGFVDMVAIHAYDHEWVGRSFIKHKKISKLWKFLKKHLLLFFQSHNVH
jgi:hypothetical protein